MAWNCPQRLQDSVAAFLAKSITRFTEERIRGAIALVPPELLIARATAGLIRHRCLEEESIFVEDDDDEKETTTHLISYEDDLDDMDLALLVVKEALDQVKDWLSKVPQNPGGPRGSLERAFDVYSDVHPKYDKDFGKHLTGILMKFTVLESVFIDRDYGDKDKQCVIPFAWEGWVTKLVHILGPFESLLELKVYGGMYPSILEAILQEAPNLKSLFISHINITDELLIIASKSCPMLEKFYLLHNFPWQVISMKAFCKTFFKGRSLSKLSDNVLLGEDKCVYRSFTSLKEVEVAYGRIEVAKNFHKLLLAYYPELTSYTCEWKTNVFDDQYSNHGRDILMPITRNGKVLSVTKVFFECGVVYTMGLERLHKFAWCCPDVRSLVLDLTNMGTAKICKSAGRQMLELILEWPKVEELHLNLHCDDEFNMSFLMPIMSTKGQALKSLILEAPTVSQCLNSSIIIWFLQQCPNLVRLKMHVWQRSMLNVPNNGEGLSFPVCQNLKEISFHEDGPGDNDTPAAEPGHRQRWCAVLEALLKSAQNLQILSISMCHGLSSLLKNSVCNVEIFHLHVKSCYERNPSVEKIQGLVNCLPNLQWLYLEELRGSTYWRIWRHYRHTGLNIRWGNLYGWPRT
ncbi:uncharacterized protein [Macrobrachium rosenbergii]|uniref:uncharacterized protein n=1 Tax=Macrobrachium rosenbergii TaxID=79674 RepID=UPI0034D567BD